MNSNQWLILEQNEHTTGSFKEEKIEPSRNYYLNLRPSRNKEKGRREN